MMNRFCSRPGGIRIANYLSNALQGLLVKAKSIVLSQNGLSGTIPTEFGNLYGATVLDLSGNQLSGPIPSELGAMDSNAQPLELTRSNDDGTRNTTQINLGGNELTGTVPASLGMLGELRVLDISGNIELTGTIPESLCVLESWPDGGGIKLECELVNCTCDACACL